MTRSPVTPILSWLEEPHPTRGVRFCESKGDWTRLTYVELADRVRQAQAGLVDVGVRRGDIVPLMLPAGADFLAHFYAILALGAVPSCLPLPTSLRVDGAFATEVLAIIAQVRPPAVIVPAAHLGLFAGVLPHITVVPPRYADRPLTLEPGELAAVQFTSGSRGRPRGVRVTMNNLEQNVAMITAWSGLDEYGTVSWLPLNHDMGLVGGLIVPVTGNTEHALTRPDHFIRDTLGWLSEFDRTPYASLVMPNFGFDMVNRKVAPDDVVDMDLSNITTVISGAERVDPAVMARFAGLLEPAGFHVRALRPAYGMAEATLIVSGVSTPTPARLVKLADSHRAIGDPVEVVASEVLSTRPVPDPWAWQVSCGTPLGDLSVRILDEDGEELPPGAMGEIEVSGSSIVDGYLHATGEDCERLYGGRLRTRDAGFVLDGELYVIGRMGDSVKTRGRSVFVEDVELEVCGTGLMPPATTTVVAGMRDGRATVVVVAEHQVGGAAREEVCSIVRRHTGDEPEIDVVEVIKGSVPRTSSRKPKRSTLWQSYLNATLRERGDDDHSATSHA